MTVAQSYMQPHEGVRGEARPDDPILTMPVAGRGVLAGVVYKLYVNSLIGNAPPVVRETYERMTHPRPGDYVIVRDIVGSRDEENIQHGVGIFLGDRREWWTTDEQWEIGKAEDGTLTDADRMVDRAWYVQYGPDPGMICRWVNCELLAIPDATS